MTMKPNTIFEINRTLRFFIAAASILIGISIIFNTIDVLADRDLVHLNVVINSLLNLSGDVKISYAITGSAIAWGCLERRLRKKIQKNLKEKENNRNKK